MNHCTGSLSNQNISRLPHETTGSIRLLTWSSFSWTLSSPGSGSVSEFPGSGTETRVLICFYSLSDSATTKPTCGPLVSVSEPRFGAVSCTVGTGQTPVTGFHSAESAWICQRDHSDWPKQSTIRKTGMDERRWMFQDICCLKRQLDL